VIQGSSYGRLRRRWRGEVQKGDYLVGYAAEKAEAIYIWHSCLYTRPELSRAGRRQLYAEGPFRRADLPASRPPERPPLRQGRSGGVPRRGIQDGN
jgi:hypothetical protein